jgi:hypothetical protein
MKIQTSFQSVVNEIVRKFHYEADNVPVGHWQGQDLPLDKLPAFVSREIFNHSFCYQIPVGLTMLKLQIEPNLPWADEHFGERVSGIPYNPAPSYVRWPFWQASSEQTKEVDGKKFSHTYPERFWPPGLMGIRYTYGTLDAVVNLLTRQPLTRQAYLPIWFPEDTGVSHEGRVPCTLGYHFMQRGGQLHIIYPIRSCDFFRHFRDDAYMACRLALWVLEELKLKSPKNWESVTIGTLTMHLFSLHIFRGEVDRLGR